MTNAKFEANEIKGKLSRHKFQEYLFFWFIHVSVSHSLSRSSVNGPNNSYRIIDNEEVRFTLVPTEACTEDMVLMVLSAPNNVHKRNLMRTRISNVDDVKLIFLLGLSTKHQKQIDTEHVGRQCLTQSQDLEIAHMAYAELTTPTFLTAHLLFLTVCWPS